MLSKQIWDRLLEVAENNTRPFPPVARQPDGN